jgi:probable rRNA maturation factor
MDIVDPDGNKGASLVIANDDTLQNLNLKFRGFDEITDVLSFGQSGTTHSENQPEPDKPPLHKVEAFPEQFEEFGNMGEVVISFPQTARQALENNNAIAEELALLIVHGILHLFGFDHAYPEEEIEMKTLERQALARIKS